MLHATVIKLQLQLFCYFCYKSSSVIFSLPKKFKQTNKHVFSSCALAQQSAQVKVVDQKEIYDFLGV